MKVKKVLLLFACFFVLGISQVLAQTIQVSGKVNNKANGQPLPGATVSIKGSKTATTTDSEGNFSITVPNAGSVLVFSYVNTKTTELKINDNNPVVVALEAQANTLEEVVINVGYGTQKKSVNTGSISSVRAKDLEKVPVGRVEQALQGRVSGVTVAANAGQPGSSATIRVRGITTFGDGGNNPLWVVDGIVVDNGAIGYLNQSDIESIEVLKDAASAAIYGTRAATGVILITTKKGRAGKFTVNYNAYWGTSAPAKRLELLNATQYATLFNEKSVAGGGPILFPHADTLGAGTDWQKEIFNTHAGLFSHELSVSGGNEKSQFYLSFGWQDQEGIVASNISHYTRKSIRINSTHKISKVFSFGETVGYAHKKTVGLGNTNSEFGGPLSSAINLDPITKAVIYDTAVANTSPYTLDGAQTDPQGHPYGISKLVGNEMTNPKAYIQTKAGNYDWSDDIVGNVYLEVNITKNIKLKSTIGGKLSYWGGQAFTPLFYLGSSPGASSSQNSLTKNTNTALDYNLENTATYSRKFGSHGLEVLLGQGGYVSGNGGGTNITLVNLPITSYEDASFNFEIPPSDRKSGSYDYTPHKLSSLFARLNYNYQEKYLFTGIIRRDGSSRFGPNHKFGTFPSFSAGWLVNKENFWSSNKYVRSLKIRGGYGTVGNDAIADFGYISRVSGSFYYPVGNTGTITTGYSPTSVANANLKWEQTSQGNIGFDAQILNDFNLTVDWYKKKTKGILRPLRIPGYVGVTESPLANVADMQNSGLEVELGWQRKIGQFNLSANANIATLKNKVTYVSADTNFIDGETGFQSMGAVTRTQVGLSYNTFWGYRTAGIFQNEAEVAAYSNKDGGLIQPDARPGDFRWVDVNGDGKIDGKDQTNLGNSIPKFTFGLTINVSWKGFDLMAFGQGATGNKIFQGLRRLDLSNVNYQTKALSRWHGEGTSNSYPRLTTDDKNGNFTSMSDFYLEKGDYFRLKVVSLGYSFNNNFLKNKLYVTKLRVYLTSENLATITKYDGYDPEIGGGVFGIDKGFYPQARSFIAGVQLQF